MLPEPLRPKQLHHLLTWPSQSKPKPSRAASEANPSGRPTCRGGNKTAIETQGSVAKEEDPKPSHQLYKLQIESTQSTRQTCVYGIYKKTLRAPAKVNTVLVSGPAVGATQTLIWSYFCVFLPPISTAIRTSAFSFVGDLIVLLYIP